MTLNAMREALQVRNARIGDVPEIRALVAKTYQASEIDVIDGVIFERQIIHYPDGQLVVVFDGEVVGYAACFRIGADIAMKPHTYAGITGDGTARLHDPEGEWLYGMEVAVDPDRRRLRIGQRLYDARRAICEAEGLKGIVFGGRMPRYGQHADVYPDPVDYLQAVIDKKIEDPVIGFHLRSGFEPLGILPGYLPEDQESLGCAAHMVWRNPYVEAYATKGDFVYAQKEQVRVGTVQFQQRMISSFDDFIANVEYFVDVCTDYRCDFVVFPEMFTLQLLCLATEPLSPAEALASLTAYTPRFIDALREMAIGFNINIIGGSHPTRTSDGEIQNVAYIFLRDGSVHTREKIHPTPNERRWWAIQGGDEVSTITTDCGPIGVLICYDSEFPELARKLADEGARILFVPFCTDNRQGYLRVRYCCQARAIENQLYVVMSGNVGNLPNVENMDVQYAQSAILTPCDFPFARDGIAAEATENVETVTIADLDLTDLSWARSEGTVQNLRDRRTDLYRTIWSDGPDWFRSQSQTGSGDGK
jgi:predicted amidohydrolase/GNAT superfamily N-acetyltransferase